MSPEQAIVLELEAASLLRELLYRAYPERSHYGRIYQQRVANLIPKVLSRYHRREGKYVLYLVHRDVTSHETI